MRYKVEFSVINTEEDLVEHYRKHLLTHLTTVFLWEGFPKDTPTEYLEMTLFLNGCCGIMKKGEQVIPVLCNPSEKPDEYYRATSYIYANPVLGSGNIDPEWVVFNDNLSPWFPRDGKELIDKYARLLAAADISLRIALKNTRLTNIIVTDNEDDVANVNKMLGDIWNGAGATTVSTKTLIGDGLKVLPTVQGGVDYLRQLAETREYLYNLFLSEFGIHANTVLKRERQLTGEIDMQVEKPQFNIETMLQARQRAAERLSELLGTEITVQVNPKFMYVEQTTEGSEEDVSTPDSEADTADVSDKSDAAGESDNVSDNGSGD